MYINEGCLRCSEKMQKIPKVTDVKNFPLPLAFHLKWKRANHSFLLCSHGVFHFHLQFSLDSVYYEFLMYMLETLMF